MVEVKRWLPAGASIIILFSPEQSGLGRDEQSGLSRAKSRCTGLTYGLLAIIIKIPFGLPNDCSAGIIIIQSFYRGDNNQFKRIAFNLALLLRVSNCNKSARERESQRDSLWHEFNTLCK